VSIQLLEGLTAAGVGAADAAISDKAGNGPGGIPWGAYFEGGAIAVGMFGQMVGLGADIRDPVGIAGLALAGRRATKLAMAGKLFTPSAWAGVGGDGGGGDFMLGAPPARNMAPGVRVLGAGGARGGYPLYPYSSEMPGVAG
jgi:hypothetical protein